MARNKYPEETIKRILQSALRLFLEKGYERTTIQDIIDVLGNLSKGAIYHHFKGKEDIFEAVMELLFAGTEDKMDELIADQSLSGGEKLRRMFAQSLGNKRQLDLFSMAPNMRNNSKFLGVQLCSVQEVAEQYVAPVIQQGVEDGSIQTEYPAELAETVMLLANFWLNPMIFTATSEQMDRRFAFTKQFLECFGMPQVVDDSMLEQLQAYRAAYAAKQTSQKK